MYLLTPCPVFPPSISSIVNVPGESTLRRDFIRLQQENKERSEALRHQQLLQEQQLREQEEYKRQLLAERQKRIEQQKEQRRRLEEVRCFILDYWFEILKNESSEPKKKSTFGNVYPTATETRAGDEEATRARAASPRARGEEARGGDGSQT